MMQKRIAAIFLALLFVLCGSLTASAERTSQPFALFSGVSDDAAVLMDQTEDDVVALNERSSIQFHVLTKHFLGGAEAQAYCDDVFADSGFTENDFLLLLVVGEERYAVSMGSVVKSFLSQEQLSGLLSSKLRQPFLAERDYDGAVGSFILAAAAQIARATGEKLSTAGLFGTANSAPDVVKEDEYDFASWAGEWWSGFFGREEKSGDPYSQDRNGDTPAYAYESNMDDNGFSFGKLLFILGVLMIISKKRRKKGKSGLGILGLFTLAKGAQEISKATFGGQSTVRSRTGQRPGSFTRSRSTVSGTARKPRR